MRNSLVRIGITMGDPSGVGPEIIAKAALKLKGRAKFIVIGDAGVMSRVPQGKSLVRSDGFIDLGNVVGNNFSFGKIKAEYGKASIEYLDKAMELIASKDIDCVVTCPISKEAIHAAGYRYAGHTEYFAKKTKVSRSVMMLLNDKLRFSLVTKHIPLAKVSSSLSEKLIKDTISLTYDALKRYFAIHKARIVVCGLNPHASDRGVIGSEELSIINPALKKLRRKIGVLDGPYSADVAIAKSFHGLYDCVIAMYHDQALIPLKLTGFDQGVNITLGLPFVRTSVLHGTAFDIARYLKKANPNSLISAIQLGLQCTSNLRKA